MFCPQDLAARIDRAEGRLCATVASREAADRAEEMFVAPVAGGTAVFAARASPVNKLIGAGFGVPIDEGELRAVEAHFAAHGARLQAEVATLADPEFHSALTARGYVPSGFENVLGRALAPERPKLPAGIEVLAVGPEHLALLADVLVESFLHADAGGVGGDALPSPEVMRRTFLATMDTPGFRGYVARIDGENAGGASLRLDDGIAQFAGAATLPRFRRRGVQTALLAARLGDAAAAGADLAVIVTQPGSKSQQNATRAGFALLYVRQLLVKAPA
jgi:ribosomal protein S18 acetylase RimI-like enzyme